MFEDHYGYPWVLKAHEYRTVEDLLEALERRLIPAALECTRN
jgi:hypothetical protein